MKKILKFALCATMLVFSALSCNLFEPEPEPEPEKKPIVHGPAELKSFQFLAEDNVDIIYKDIEGVIDGTNVAVQVPEGTEVSALVARFEVSPNDTVKVDGVLQESGKTVNSFEAPVDYVVNEGTSVKSYKVTVSELPAGTWSRVASYPVDGIKLYKSAINPKTGEPAFLVSESDYQLSYVELKNGAFAEEYILDSISGRYIGFNFGTDGTPYASFCHDNKNMSVVAKSGTSWAFVGEEKFGSRSNSYSSEIIEAPDGKVMMFYSMNAAANGLAKRELSVCTWDGSAWTVDQSLPVREPGAYGYWPKAVVANDVLYLGVFNPVNPNSFDVYSYKDGVWEVLVDKYNQKTAEGADTATPMYGFGIAADAKGNVYISIANNSETTQGSPRVFKYDAETKTVEQLGQSIICEDSVSARYNRVVVGYDYNVYFLYLNTAGNVCATKLNKKTQQWEDPTIISPNDGDTDIDLVINADGVPYASFFDNANKQIVVYKYE